MGRENYSLYFYKCLKFSIIKGTSLMLGGEKLKIFFLLPKVKN